MHTLELKDGKYKLVAFDTETTGINPLSDHIITFGFSTEEEPEQELMIQLPDSVEELSESNIAVHGYSLEEIKKNGKDRKESLSYAFNLLDKFVSEGGIIVGHNLAYDMTIFYSEIFREGMTKEAEKIKKWPIIDTLVLAESDDMFGLFKMSLKLNDLALTIGVDTNYLENAHNAGADSLVSIALLQKMMDYFPHLKMYSKNDLLDFINESALRLQYRKLAIFKSEEKLVGFPVMADISTAKKNVETSDLKKDTSKKKRKSPAETSERKPTRRSKVRSSKSTSSRFTK